MTKLLHLTILFSFLSLIGCKKDELVSPSDPEITENYNPPQDNSKILEEKWYSNLKFTSFHGIFSLNDGTFLVYGTETSSNDGVSFIKKINSNGSQLWSISANMRVRQIQSISSSVYIAVGGLDNDADNSLENASIITFDGNGNILDQKSKSDNSAIIYLNGVVKLTSTVDTTNFYAYGGAKKSTIYYPQAMNIKISSSGKIFFGTNLTNTDAWKEGIDYNQPNKYYTIISLLDNNTIACLGNAIPKSDQSYIQKIDFKISMSSISENSIVGTVNRGFKVVNNELYICGSIYDQTTPAASGGEKWSDGMLAKINSSGNVVWKQTLASGTTYKKGEFIRSLDVANGKVYFCGDQSQFFANKNSQYFGNGYAGSLDAANGSILSTMTFGDKLYQSGINACAYYAGQLVNIGYTKYSKSGEGYQGWFFKVNM